MENSYVPCIFIALILGVNSEIVHTSRKGNEYFIETESQHTWYEALYECARRNMSLIAIDTVEIQHELTEVLHTAKDIYRWHPSKLWIGGIGTGNGNYIWVTTGTKFNFTNWSKGEPDREKKAQQCAALHAKRMTWYIRKCSGKRGLICEGNRLLKAKDQELSEVKQSCADQMRLLENKHKIELDVLQRNMEL